MSLHYFEVSYNHSIFLFHDNIIIGFLNITYFNLNKWHYYHNEKVEKGQIIKK